MYLKDKMSKSLRGSHEQFSFKAIKYGINICVWQILLEYKNWKLFRFAVDDKKKKKEKKKKILCFPPNYLKGKFYLFSCTIVLTEKLMMKSRFTKKAIFILFY